MERTHQPEFLDSNQIPQHDLNANLADMARLNRLTGTTRAVCRSVLELAAGRTGFSLLDVGAGSGDLAAALQSAAGGRGMRCTPFAADLHSGVLRTLRARHPELAGLQVEGTALPFPARSVDITMC